MTSQNILNVYEQVDLNKKKSLLVVVLFVLFVTLFIWLIGQAFGTDKTIIFWAASLSLISALTGYFAGDKLILNLSGAKIADKQKNFKFCSVAENLAILTQIPIPKLYVIESQSLNAFATGRDPKHAAVCITSELEEKLNRSELEAVIAHEFSHILNYDIRLMMVVGVLVGMITLLTDWLLRTNRIKSDKKRDANPAFLAIGLIGLILSPILAKLIQLAISRRREILADASAVKLTRYPQGLISALQIISKDPNQLKSANAATAHLFIVNPFKKRNDYFNKINTLFLTHPPIEQRIAELKKML